MCFDPEMLAGAMILLPLLEPLGLWTHALLEETARAPGAVASGAAAAPDMPERDFRTRHGPAAR
jgi:hypothetical protein